RFTHYVTRAIGEILGSVKAAEACLALQLQTRDASDPPLPDLISRAQKSLRLPRLRGPPRPKRQAVAATRRAASPSVTNSCPAERNVSTAARRASIFRVCGTRTSTWCGRKTSRP